MSSLKLTTAAIVTISVVIGININHDDDNADINTKEVLNVENFQYDNNNDIDLSSFDSNQRNLLWSWSNRGDSSSNGYNKKSWGWSKNGGSSSSDNNKNKKSWTWNKKDDSSSNNKVSKHNNKESWSWGGKKSDSSDSSNGNKKSWSWSSKKDYSSSNNNGKKGGNKGLKRSPTPRPTKGWNKEWNKHHTPRPTKSASRPTPRPTNTWSKRWSKGNNNRKDSSSSSDNGRKGRKGGRKSNSSSDSSDGGKRGKGRKHNSSSDSKDGNGRKPTPRPTKSRPAPRPTPKPTRSKRTPRPTPRPTPPTPRPTRRTPRPTPKPTDNPTEPPTEQFCQELEETRADVLILVDNGCVIPKDVCVVQNLFLSSLVERIYAPSARVSIRSYNSELEFTGIDFGELDDFESERDNALSLIPSIVCNQGPMEFPTAITTALDEAIDFFDDNTPEGVERRLIIVSYCDATDLDDNDDVCDEFEPLLEENGIITYIVNLGGKIESNAYKCLAPDFAPNDFIDSVDPVDLNILVPEVREGIVEQVCSVIDIEKPTPNPTEPPADVVTPQPSDQPTDQPTDNPTEPPVDVDTGSPSDQPTDQPTDNPTEPPVDLMTTPSPTEAFCPELEEIKADVVILIDNGCVISEDACNIQNTFLSSLVERIFAPLARVFIVNYNSDLEFTGINFGDLEDFQSERDNALSLIPDIVCNEGPMVFPTDLGTALDGVIDIFENNTPDGVERRLILLSYCDATDLDDNDEICDDFEPLLEEFNIITYVLNLGNQIESDAYECLTPDFAPDEFGSVDPIDEDVLIPGIREAIVDQVCSLIAPLPTPNPTNEPTEEPTDQPTEFISMAPTERPTKNPTDRRPRPTPRPTKKSKKHINWF